MAGHNERLGPSQFRDLLSMLQVDITAHEAMRMFRRMDEDDSGSIEFEEFAEAMLEQFSQAEIEQAASIEIGSMGTRMWSRGEIAWSINNCLIVSASCKNSTKRYPPVVAMSSCAVKSQERCVFL